MVLAENVCGTSWPHADSKRPAAIARYSLWFHTCVIEQIHSESLSGEFEDIFGRVMLAALYAPRYPHSNRYRRRSYAAIVALDATKGTAVTLFPLC